MSARWLCLCLPVAFALACGGGSGSKDDGSGNPDTIDIGFDGTEDPGPGDGGPDVADADVPVTPDAPDVAELPGDEGLPDLPDTAGDPGPGEVPGDATEEVAVPICPCVEVPEAPVCGTDGKTYLGDTCAKCAICKAADDCVGCTGTETCQDNPGGLPSYITQKAECGVCLCDIVKACEFMSGGDDCKTQSVCDVDNKPYTDLCDLMKKAAAAGAACSYDFETFNYFLPVGETSCKQPPCEGCELTPDNPMCGDDGKTYRNKCEMTHCPKTPGVKATCLGACVNDSFCPACKGLPCSPVCGDDGITYANQCAATTCGTKGKLVASPGACCPECDAEAVSPVCGLDGKTYKNTCAAVQCGGVATCPPTKNEVCGVDGITHDNECQASCSGGTLHPGKCLGLCDQCPKDLAPVCGRDKDGKPRSFQNACYATCLGGTVDSQGLCQAGCREICGDLPAQPWATSLCYSDGIKYPDTCFPTKCFGGLTPSATACP